MLIQLLVAASLMFGVSAPPAGFTVEAQHVTKQSKLIGKTRVQRKLIGKIRVQNGETATLRGPISQEPFVTEVNMVRGDNNTRAYEPTITVLSDGVSVKVKVDERDLHEISQDTVFVDVTAESSEIVGSKVKILDDKPSVDKAGNAVDGTTVQTAQEETKTTRLITPVKLGEPLTISLGEGSNESVEITVRR